MWTNGHSRGHMRRAPHGYEFDARGRDGGVREELTTNMIIKTPLPGSEALLRKVQKALGPACIHEGRGR